MAMQLSAELFNEIVKKLRSDLMASRSNEKRRQGRVGLRCSLDILPCAFDDDGTRSLNVCVRDISVEGLGFISPVELPLDMEFVALFKRDGRKPLPIMYRVKNCRKVTNDIWALGAMFDRVLPESAAYTTMTQHFESKPVYTATGRRR